MNKKMVLCVVYLYQEILEFYISRRFVWIRVVFVERSPEKWTRSQFRQLVGFTRNHIVRMSQADSCYRSIASETHFDVTIMHRIWTRWIENERWNGEKALSPSRRTTERSNGRIVRKALAVPQTSTLDISQNVQLWIPQYLREQFHGDCAKAACIQVRQENTVIDTKSSTWKIKIVLGPRHLDN